MSSMKRDQCEPNTLHKRRLESNDQDHQVGIRNRHTGKAELSSNSQNMNITLEVLARILKMNACL